ncbi:MAG: NAD(P)-binding domain-containing protein [Lactimicrobium sp.]|jgi:2-hydroxy-3-oxopropionate reductase|uniref:NAD(P)-binding domain-containing protein n=1 Tax=Lactimicrobium sp. TaxID=2563780 RepID=UPI002F351457
MKLGMIGLGVMGRPMALNLKKAGYDLCVSPHRANMNDYFASFGIPVVSKKEIGESCDVVLLMLPDSKQVEAVMLEEDRLAEIMKPGSCLIDMSSIDPSVSRKVNAQLAKRGIDMLDAPVSGGEPGAIEGTLSFMVGGKQEVFDKYRPILLAMGSSAVLVGEIGAGNTAKLCNQIIVAGNLMALAEGITLAQQSGLDPSVVIEALTGGLADSAVMHAKAQMMIDKRYDPGFRIDLHIKDLNNALHAANDTGTPALMTAQVKEIMQWLHSHDLGNKDHSAIKAFYDTLAEKK